MVKQVALTAVLSLIGIGTTFAQGCLHALDEPTEQRDRRVAAVLVAEEINTAESQFQKTGYRPLSELPAGHH